MNKKSFEMVRLHFHKLYNEKKVVDYSNHLENLTKGFKYINIIIKSRSSSMMENVDPFLLAPLPQKWTILAHYIKYMDGIHQTQIDFEDGKYRSIPLGTSPHKSQLKKNLQNKKESSNLFVSFANPNIFINYIPQREPKF